MPLVSWRRLKWDAFVLLEFLWITHGKHQAYKLWIPLVYQHKLCPKKPVVITGEPFLCLQSRYSQSWLVEKFCGQGMLCLECICVPKMLQISFPSCAAFLKISAVSMWQRKGLAKLQTSKLRVPSLTQAFRWRLLGSVQSSWEDTGGAGGKVDGGVH